MSANVVISNIKTYYKGSGFESTGGVNGAIDSSKVVLKSGATTQLTSFANLSGYTRGINGLVIDVAGLVGTSLTAADFTFGWVTTIIQAAGQMHPPRPRSR